MDLAAAQEFVSWNPLLAGGPGYLDAAEQATEARRESATRRAEAVRAIKMQEEFWQLRDQIDQCLTTIAALGNEISQLRDPRVWGAQLRRTLPPTDLTEQIFTAAETAKSAPEQVLQNPQLLEQSVIQLRSGVRCAHVVIEAMSGLREHINRDQANIPAKELNPAAVPQTLGRDGIARLLKRRLPSLEINSQTPATGEPLRFAA